MSMFEKRGTRPGYIQVNMNLWIFVIVCLCVSTGLAIFFGVRDPLGNSVEKRALQVLTYNHPSCFKHVVDSIAFFHDGTKKVEVTSCGVKDYYVVTDSGIEYAKESPNYGKPLTRR